MENILCAAGVGFALKLPGKTIKAGIEETGNVPGRLESVDNNSGKFIYIDYAHTPDALENVLTLLVNLKTKKMICIFGCGGDRDKDKRPVMGEIAGKFCDFIVITSDNPRTEEPMRIIRDIENGVKKTSPYNYSPDEFKEGIAEKGYTVEPDRQKAIRLGIRVANKGDIVLIAGKGHENYQILNNKIIEFDDRVIAKQAFLNNKLNEATL
jgi:UDP-N-acetylmuramyl-tripeptide synthetase